jgi:O-antigen ligase
MYKGSRIQGIGIFSDPNDLALALVIVLPYLFLKLVERAKPWEKILAAAAMLVLVYALYLTSSRGGMLAFGVLMLILFSRRYGILPGIILGSVLMFAVFVVVPRMMTISMDEASSYGRVEAWGLGLDLFEQFPFFGVGTGSFTEYHFRTAHNSFVLCAAELGVFGLLPWIMLIYLSIKNNHFVSRNTTEAHMEEVLIYADTIRYGLIAFVLGAYFLSRTYSELLFVLIGLSVATTQIFVEDSEEKYKLVERKDFVYAFLLLVAAWIFTKGFLYFAW